MDDRRRCQNGRAASRKAPSAPVTTSASVGNSGRMQARCAPSGLMDTFLLTVAQHRSIKSHTTCGIALTSGHQASTCMHMRHRLGKTLLTLAAI